MPLNYLTLVRARNYFLAVFHPLYLEEGPLMCILDLPYEISARSLPIRIEGLTASFLLGSVDIHERFVCWEQVLGERVIRVNARSIFRIEVVVVILLVVVYFQVVWVNLLPLLGHSSVVHVC